MPQQEASREGMQSVLRSLETLEVIARLQPVRLSDLARAVALPKTTVARIVRTLSTAGWIAADAERGDPRWRLTPRALAVGATVATEVDLRVVARSAIDELRAAVDENIHLSSPDGETMVLVERAPSSRSVQTVASVGDRAPMHLTASGWAYLAHLSDEEVDAVLPDGLAATTALSIVDRGALRQELHAVAARGYAVNPGRWRSDVAAIAAAVLSASGRPIAAVSISMPSYRFTAELADPYGGLVRATCERISRELARVTRSGVRA